MRTLLWCDVQKRAKRNKPAKLNGIVVTNSIEVFHDLWCNDCLHWRETMGGIWSNDEWWKVLGWTSWQTVYYRLQSTLKPAILTAWTKHKPSASTHKASMLLMSVSPPSLLSASLLSVLTLLLLVLRVLLVRKKQRGKSIGELSTTSWLLTHSLPYLVHDLHTRSTYHCSTFRVRVLVSWRLRSWHRHVTFRVSHSSAIYVTWRSHQRDIYWRHLYSWRVHVQPSLITTQRDSSPSL